MNRFTAEYIGEEMVPMLKAAVSDWNEGDEKKLEDIVGSRNYEQLQLMAHGRTLGHILRDVIKERGLPLVRTQRNPAKLGSIP